VNDVEAVRRVDDDLCATEDASERKRRQASKMYFIEFGPCPFFPLHILSTVSNNPEVNPNLHG
jgi:hypothetical protein